MDRNKKEAIMALCIVAVIALLGFAFYIIIGYYNNEKAGNNYVSEVIDGDTFEMNTGETIRLLCVDAPEQGQEDYDEAKDFLEHLILHRNVRLESSNIEDDKDKYGRLLRFVYVNISDIEVFVNKEVIRLEYGNIFNYGNITNCQEILGR
jgi:endonuclease YncB( thermonuclease family)